MQSRPSQGARRKEEEPLRFLKSVDLWSVKQEDGGDPQASGGKQLWSRPVLVPGKSRRDPRLWVVRCDHTVRASPGLQTAPGSHSFKKN